MDHSEQKAQLFSRQLFDQYLQLGVDSRVVVSTDPWVEIEINPSIGKIALRTDQRDARTDDRILSNYTQISVTNLESWRGPVEELSIRLEVDDWFAFAFLVAVLERLVESISFENAIRLTLEAYEGLLGRTAETATLEQVVGLYGELLVLAELRTKTMPAIAIAAWHGPASVEHDFVLRDGTFEVKTTTSEGRLHTISSLRQLEPLSDKPLDLVSVRITDSPNGESLRALIDRVASVMEGQAELFRKKIGSLRFVNESSLALDRRFALRGEIALFRVGVDVWPLTRNVLNRALDDSTHIQKVSYVLNLEGTNGAELSERLATYENSGKQ